MASNQQILLASLLASNVKIPRIGVLENEISKHVLPPLPYIYIGNKDVVTNNGAKGYDSVGVNVGGVPIGEAKQFFPLSFRKVGDQQSWTLPYEPIVNISGKNNVVKRNVAKGNKYTGTIKERVSQDDYAVTISGYLFGENTNSRMEDCYPIDDFQKLRDYMVTAEAIEVFCEPLQLLGITRLVVESFDFPFTKGDYVQMYEIKCVSDDSYDLLIELNEQ